MSKYIIYTYQFSPLQHFSGVSFNDYATYAERAMDRKQEIFGMVLESDDLNFSLREKVFIHKLLIADSGIFILKIANIRETILEHGFQKNKIEFAPSCFVIIDNRPDSQVIAIEEDLSAFYNTNQVANILENSFNFLLRQYGLRIIIHRTYQHTEFWHVVNSHKDKVQMVRFHFSYPNLPRVNQTIKEVISSVSRSTNSKQSSFELKSAKGETLSLEEDNGYISDLANYAADSGDLIEIKAIGQRRFIKIGETRVEVEIEDLDPEMPRSLLQKCIDRIIKILNRNLKRE